VVRRVAVVDVPVDHRPHLFGERLRLALCQPQERAPSTCHVGLAFDTPLAVTFGLVLLLQAGQTVAGPTWQALVPSIADEDEIGRVVSTSQAMTTTVSVAAPAVAGLTVALVGYGAPLLIDAATFVVLGIAGAMIYTGRRAHDAVAGAAAGATDASYSLRTDRCSGRCWLCALVLVGEVTNVVEVFLVRGALGAGPTAFGLVAATLAAGLVGGAMLAARARSQAARAQRAVLAAIVLGCLLVVAGSAPRGSMLGAMALGGAAGELARSASPRRQR
jgi:hypothetical protein